MHPTSGVRIRRDADHQTVKTFINVQDDMAILNIFSVDGFGKSQFLQDVALESSAIIPLAFVHAKDGRRVEDGGYALDRLIKAIVKDLAQNLAEHHPQTTVAPAPTNDADVIQDLLNNVDLVLRVGKGVLFIIDDYDAIPPGVRAVFESNFLHQLIHRDGRVRVILSSAQQLTFPERLDLRLRLTTRPLSRPSENDIASSIPPEYQALAPLISRWTGGLPDMVGYLLTRAQAQHQTGFDTIGLDESALLGTEYPARLRNVVFEDIAPPPNDSFEILGLLRSFDIAGMRYVLAHVHPEIFEEKKQIFYLDLIHEMGSRISWRPQYGYSLDGTLRDLIRNYVCRFDRPLFMRVNNIVVAMYTDWLSEGYRQQYLLELLYHFTQLQLASDEAESTIGERVGQRLLAYMSGERRTGPATIEQIDGIKSALLQDSDLRPYLDNQVWASLDQARARLG
jgi:hypothetical protein